MVNKKGQAAMEYLMTYGWAILVIVIVLAALLYLGVFNVGQRVPEQCNLPVGIMCTSAKLTPTNLDLKLKNGHGVKINICGIYCDDTQTAEQIMTANGMTVQQCTDTPMTNGQIEVGEETSAPVQAGAGCIGVGYSSGPLNPPAVGARYSGKLFIQYIEVTDDAAGSVRITQGTLQAVTQAV
jgi:hypothetical protein